MIKFIKMQSTGNDYICIDDRKDIIKKPEILAQPMCDRHFGIGADGIILLKKSSIADFQMRIFNSDSSEAEMCGNGIRCLANYIYDHGISKKNILNIETKSGLREISIKSNNDRAGEITTNLGEPILRRDRIPVAGGPGMMIDETLQLPDGTKFQVTAVSMGNPHAVIFVEDTDLFPLEKYGPAIVSHPSFPQQTNVEVVKIINENEVIQRTYERGVGETLSCGTGASAVTVAGVLNKLTSRNIKITLRGGSLKTEWKESDNCIYLSGQAYEVFTGEWPD